MSLNCHVNPTAPHRTKVCGFFFFRSFVFLDAVGGYHRRPPGPRLSQFLSKNKKKCGRDAHQPDTRLVPPTRPHMTALTNEVLQS